MKSITKLTKIDFLIVKATKQEENFDSSNHWDDLTMPYYYYLASILFGILGLAFFMVWIGDRLNRAALLWGIAHLNLGVASLTGYQYQHSQWFPLALVSLVSTALFLVLLLTGTQALIGRIQKWRFIGQQTILMTITIGIIGFGMSQDIARFLVSLLMMMIYLWAGFTFARQQKEYWIGIIFILKAMVLIVPAIVDPTTSSTLAQPLFYTVFNWSMSLVLALGLVFIAARQSHRWLQQVLYHLPDALVASNLQGKVLFCNDHFAKMAGFSKPEKLVGQPLPLLANDHDEALSMLHEMKKLAQADALTKPIALERMIQPMSALAAFPAEISVSAFKNFGQTILIGQIRDLTERKQAEQERLRLSTTDDMTGLPNRQHLEHKLATILWECERQKTQCAVLLIDLDHLKHVNDMMGRAHGDKVIKKTANLLRTMSQDRDVLGRINSDEFALVISDIQSNSDILAIEERARSMCQQLSREIRQGTLQVMIGASIGIALSGSEGDSPTNLLQHAEMAMYEAKARGRGGWCFFEPDMDEKLASALRLESELRLALHQPEQLQLAYQPIVDAHSGKLVKVEALLRWNSPTLGAVSPARFIPIAEQSALILDLGDWVLNEAIQQAARWSNEMQSPPVVSINVSVRQFMQKDFDQHLVAILNRFGVAASQIELELTETLFASEGFDMPALLQRLHDIGVGLALDDFGTGYSSLSYLSRFKLSTVKIDRSFVSQIEGNDRSRSLVKAIIAMGHSLGLKVVAEGVETATQQALLTTEGCDFLQGYLLGRPMTATSIASS